MAEFLFELYSEEIPPKLQIDARNQLRKELENTLKEFSTDSDGKFEFDLPGRETETLHVSALDFIPKRFSLHLDGNPIDLGVIYLERDIAHEQTDNLISLTDDDFTEDFVFT